MIRHTWERFKRWRTDPRIDLLLKQMEKLMSEIADLKPILDAIAADVTTVQTGIAALQTQITTLTTELATAGTTLPPAAQAALDAANAEAAGIKTAMDTIAASFTPPVTPTP